MSYDLSVIIVGWNEEFLGKTVAEVLEKKRGNTEVIVACDIAWPTDIPRNPDVTVILNPVSFGQRGATNEAARLSRAKYVMKLDAHCALDEGFDVKMIHAFEEVGDNVVMAPAMRNLWAFDWKCPSCGKRTYQDTLPVCMPNERHSEPVTMKKKILWIAKTNPVSTAYCFSPEPHFQYHGDQKKKQVGDIVETMSLQGSCFMCTREKYWDLNICDEEFGSWGSQGIEVACKFWLSGGRVLVNRATWYAHMFRTKPNFSFPYQLSGRQTQHAKHRAKDIFFNGKWDRAIHPLSWLVEKFMPVPGWDETEIQKLKEMENPK